MAHPLKLFVTLGFAIFLSIVTLFACVTATILYPYRLLVLALSKILRPDLAGIIGGSGNVTFAFGSDTVPTANVVLCLAFDGVITAEEVRKRALKNILGLRWPDGSRPFVKLEQRITRFMNYGFYQRVKDFNINEHIRAYDYKGPLALPSEGLTEKDLQRMAGKLMSHPYAAGRSHWEVLVVQNYRPVDSGASEGKSLLVMRISHAIADGYSLQGILFGMFGMPDLMRKFEPPGTKSKFWTNFCKMALLPARTLWDAGAQAADLIFDECSWAIKRAEGDNGDSTMAVFTKAVHIDAIKAIKNFHRVAYASVLLTAVSSSIHRAMTEAGQRVPDKMFCILPAPRPNHPGGLTNHVYASLLQFRIVPAASTSSIARIHADLKKVVSSTTPLWLEFTFGIIATLPLFFVKLAVSVKGTSAGVGIFPVISQKLALDGKVVSGMITFVGTLSFPATNGVTVSMGGVNDFQRISICMDRRAFPDEQIFSRLPRYIEDEIDSMLESAKSRRKS